MTTKVTNARQSGKKFKPTPAAAVVEKTPTVITKNDSFEIDMDDSRHSLPANLKPPFVYEDGVYVGDRFNKIFARDIGEAVFGGSSNISFNEIETNTAMFEGYVVSQKTKVKVIIDAKSTLKVESSWGNLPWEPTDHHSDSRQAGYHYLPVGYDKKKDFRRLLLRTNQFTPSTIKSGSSETTSDKDWVIIVDSDLSPQGLAGKNLVINSNIENTSIYNATIIANTEAHYRKTVIENSIIRDSYIIDSRITNANISGSIFQDSSLNSTLNMSNINRSFLKESGLYGNYISIKKTQILNTTINAKEIILMSSQPKEQSLLKINDISLYGQEIRIYVRSQIEIGNVELGEYRIEFAVHDVSSLSDDKVSLVILSAQKGILKSIDSNMGIIQIQEIVSECLGFKTNSEHPESPTVNTVSPFGNSGLSTVYMLDPVKTSIMNYFTQTLRSRLDIIKMVTSAKSI